MLPLPSVTRKIKTAKWKKIIVSHVLDKFLVFVLYKELLQIHNRKAILTLQMGLRLGHFSRIQVKCLPVTVWSSTIYKHQSVGKLVIHGWHSD